MRRWVRIADIGMGDEHVHGAPAIPMRDALCPRWRLFLLFRHLTRFHHVGQTPTDDFIEAMIAEAPGSINFTMFLTLMGEKLSGTDPEHEILQAFEAFDDKKGGLIDAELFREAITSMGDRFTDEEVDIMFKGAPLDRSGHFNYRQWTTALKHGE